MAPQPSPTGWPQERERWHHASRRLLSSTSWKRPPDQHHRDTPGHVRLHDRSGSAPCGFARWCVAVFLRCRRGSPAPVGKTAFFVWRQADRLQSAAPSLFVNQRWTATGRQFSQVYDQNQGSPEGQSCRPIQLPIGAEGDLKGKFIDLVRQKADSSTPMTSGTEPSSREISPPSCRKKSHSGAGNLIGKRWPKPMTKLTDYYWKKRLSLPMNNLVEKGIRIGVVTAPGLVAVILLGSAFKNKGVRLSAGCSLWIICPHRSIIPPSHGASCPIGEEASRHLRTTMPRVSNIVLYHAGWPLSGWASVAWSQTLFFFQW